MTQPVIDHYTAQGKVTAIDGGPEPSEVWKSTKKAVNALVDDVFYSQQRESVFSYVYANPWQINAESMPSLIFYNKVMALTPANGDLRGVQLPDQTLYKPLVVVGPSGVGKGTLINTFVE